MALRSSVHRKGAGSVARGQKDARKQRKARLAVANARDELRTGVWSPASQVASSSGVALATDPNPPIVSENARALEVFNSGPSEQPSGLQMERMTQTLSLLFQQRIVRCGGSVDDDMANLLVAQLLYLDAQNPNRDITMYVNSPGGSVTAGMSIFDTMRHIRPNVSTVTVGLAASMGAFIAATGTPGKRYALPNSRIMIHQPLGGAQGQAADIEIQANEIMHHKATLNGYLAQFTGQPLDKITEDTDRDFFMGANEAKDYGLVDEIIMSDRAQQAAQANIPMYASTPP